MKIMKHLASTVLLMISSTGCFASGNVSEAWWLNAKIKPVTMMLNGLAPEQLDPDWVYASFLSYSDIKALTDEAGYQKFLNSRFSFAKVIDLNGNGIDEAVRVGVYTDNKQQEGVFLVIFEDDTPVKVMADSNSQGFSALLLDNGELQWYRCLECKNYERLVWAGSSYSLESIK